MGDVSLPDRADAELLTPLVRAATSLPHAAIVDWESRCPRSGSVGEVHLLEGTAKAWPGGGRVVDWALVLKVQRQWARPSDPESWRRELLMYESGLFDELADALTVPVLLRADTRDDEIWLWLERVTGVTDEGMTPAHYCHAATDLGRMQGAYLAGRELPTYPWLSSRRWVSGTVNAWGSRALHGLWRASNGEESEAGLPPKLSRATMGLWGERDRVLDALATFPLTLCHRDYNAANLFIRADAGSGATTTALDWDCAGIGTLAEDIGDMVGEAVVYYGYPPEGAAELRDATLEAYGRGLREAGWSGDQAVVRAAFATVAPLQWCFRVACLARQTDDADTLGRYASVQRFMLGLAEEARA